MIGARRVVTGHDADGRARLIADDRLAPQPIPSGDAAFALLWTTTTSPADNDDDTDGRLREAGLTVDGGSVLRIVDMLPGKASPMHRTNSIDYGVILSGSVELELDDGAVTTLYPGDVVIQRGTIHRWRNPSADTAARVLFVLIDATPRTVRGEMLPQVHP